MGNLNFWEFEFYKAFHVLRDGVSVPGSLAAVAPPAQISRTQVKAWIQRLRRMDDDQWLKANRLACAAIEQAANSQHEESRPRASGRVTEEAEKNLDLIAMQTHWAATERENEIEQLERYLNPRRIFAQAERRKVWSELVNARTEVALKKACEKWSVLPDVRGQGLTCFPNHILAHSGEFLRMRNNKRFPKTDHPAVDESRLEYLARGMAGILEGVSPMTAIERLRNMKHREGGPLWKMEPGGRQYCTCWRCSRDRWQAASRISAEYWWNGMALFMEMADTPTGRKGVLL